MTKKEVNIEVRDTGISIQGAGVGNNQDETRNLLQSALDALESNHKKQVFTNEIVIKNQLKTD